MRCRVPLWIRIHLCLLFHCKSILPLVDRQPLSVPGRLPTHSPYTHMTHTLNACWCVMACAASLLTPHMLTEAYTSLLAALTVWDPTERHSDKLDKDESRNGSNEVQWGDKHEGCHTDERPGQVGKNRSTQVDWLTRKPVKKLPVSAVGKAEL